MVSAFGGVGVLELRCVEKVEKKVIDVGASIYAFPDLE